MYETPVVQLITDESGKVTGAFVKNADGYIKVNAAKGVVLATSGGLQVNEFSQVLNTANQPIEGLYAIGNTSGSMFYGTYPHSLNCLSHTRCVVFGYNVGKFLAEK